MSELDHIVIDQNLPVDYLERALVIAGLNNRIGIIVENWQQEDAEILNYLNRNGFRLVAQI